jgi:DNA-binding NtrC family response regulator
MSPSSSASKANLPGAQPSGGKSGRILVADDQEDVLHALRLLLKGEGYEVATVTSPAAVLQAVDANEFDVALIDLNYARGTTTGREGLDLVKRLQDMDRTLPVVVMTAWGSVEGAVEAVRNGARDFIEKPWNNSRLLATLRTQLELGRALRRTQRLESENRTLRASGAGVFIAQSAAMQPVRRIMERIAPSDANVLILGEHGTGKEVVAQQMHAASARASRPLVTLNVGGLSEGVFESELFGHVKGAFTDARSDRVGRFELAHGGTLFLDEIANIPLAQQARLLRVLQTGEMERVGSSQTRQVDVRILSATNADLHKAADEGRFRQDLLFRLNTIEIPLPPLSQRTEDIPLLAAHFMKKYAAHYGKAVRALSPAAAEALLEYSWPGNVRELDHAMERAVLMATGELLDPDDLGLRSSAPGSPVRLDQMTLDEIERHVLQRALHQHQGNVNLTAEHLGLSRSALYRRLGRHGLQRDPGDAH